MAKQQHAFGKFMNVVSGAKKKEAIRQEKRKAKAERRAKGDEMRRQREEERRGYGAAYMGNRGQGAVSRQQSATSNRQERGAGQGTRSRVVRDFNRGEQENSEQRVGNRKGYGESRELRTENRVQRVGNKREWLESREKSAKSREQYAENKKPYADRSKVQGDRKETRSREQKTESRGLRTESRGQRVIGSRKSEVDRKPVTSNRKPETDNRPAASSPQPVASEMPLNKFIAHAGICSRREAVDVIKEGNITVNGQKITEPAFKVKSDDDVRIKNKRLFAQKNLVYILMNKPKDYITTAKDPEGRKTVLDLIKIQDRIFPVGRLDRNTTGVLLCTNDGELTQKLTHPSFEVKKVYEAKLDKPLVKKDFDAILKGVTLEDGVVAADVLAYADSKDKSVIGIEIHSGKNRVVRRIFEHLGYDVKNLDRVMFANLTKKNVDRGKWRFLSEKEVRLLKFMNKSFVRQSQK